MSGWHHGFGEAAGGENAPRSPASLAVSCYCLVGVRMKSLITLTGLDRPSFQHILDRLAYAACFLSITLDAGAFFAII